VSKLVAQEVGKKDVASGLKYVATAGVTVLLAGTVLSGALYIFRHQITSLLNLSRSNTSAVEALLPAVATLSVYVMLVEVNMAALQGLGRLDLDQYTRTG
jgi:Na+-driven multidrug efflux pump